MSDPSHSPTIDRGQRDPDHPYRPVLPWRNHVGSFTDGENYLAENYTITCPRCGSYKLHPPYIRALDADGDMFAIIVLECRACERTFQLSILGTRNGVMLATD